MLKMGIILSKFIFALIEKKKPQMEMIFEKTRKKTIKKKKKKKTKNKYLHKVK
jgi:hypothetical protein